VQGWGPHHFCHNEVNDKLSNLASKAMTPSSTVLGEPLISKGSNADKTKAPADKPSVQHIPHPNSRNGNGEHGNLLICGFYACSIGTVIDIHITDMDTTKSYHSKDAHKVLAGHEHEKKRKYLDACFAQH
jgi:hypothetical protein